MFAGSSIAWVETIFLPADYGSARQARDFVSGHLASHDLRFLVDDIRLVVSELVTNALVHGEPPVIVSVQEQRFIVLVTVSDKSPALPVALSHDVTASSGRGLSIVEAVSGEWGTNTRLDGGKSVWASFDKVARPTTPALSAAERA